MKYLIWVVAIFILLVVQAGILLSLHLQLANLPLVILLIGLLFAEFEFAQILALICAAGLDLASGTAGTAVLAMLILFYLMHFAVNNIVDREPNQLILFATVAGGTVIYFGLFWTVHFAFGRLGAQVPGLAGREFFLMDLPVAIVLNLVFTYPVFMFYNAVESLSRKLSRHGS